MPNALVIDRDRAAISPAARYRRASRTASIAASYSRCTSSSGSAESTRLSRYASCAFCHILVLPTPSHRQIWKLPYASTLARLQILRQLQYVLRRNLRDHILGLTIDHFDRHAPRLGVFLEHQVVLLPEHFRAVQRLDGLNHFAVLRSLFDRNGSRYRWQILRNAIQCGDIHNISSGRSGPGQASPWPHPPSPTFLIGAPPENCKSRNPQSRRRDKQKDSKIGRAHV